VAKQRFCQRSQANPFEMWAFQIRYRVIEIKTINVDNDSFHRTSDNAKGRGSEASACLTGHARQVDKHELVVMCY